MIQILVTCLLYGVGGASEAKTSKAAPLREPTQTGY